MALEQFDKTCRTRLWEHAQLRCMMQACDFDLRRYASQYQQEQDS